MPKKSESEVRVIVVLSLCLLRRNAYLSGSTQRNFDSHISAGRVQKILFFNKKQNWSPTFIRTTCAKLHVAQGETITGR